MEYIDPKTLDNTEDLAEYYLDDEDLAALNATDFAEYLGQIAAVHVPADERQRVGEHLLRVRSGLHEALYRYQRLLASVPTDEPAGRWRRGTYRLAANVLRDHSGALYAAGDDAEAESMRDAALVVEEAMRIARNGDDPAAHPVAFTHPDRPDFIGVTTGKVAGRYVTTGVSENDGPSERREWKIGEGEPPAWARAAFPEDFDKSAGFENFPEGFERVQSVRVDDDGKVTTTPHGEERAGAISASSDPQRYTELLGGLHDRSWRAWDDFGNSGYGATKALAIASLARGREMDRARDLAPTTDPEH